MGKELREVTVDDTGRYEKLAGAIVLQAVDDYRAALRRLAQNPGNDIARRTIREVERFFRSGWFGELTEIDPEMLISKLRAEVTA